MRTLAEAAGEANLTFTTGGDAEWMPNGDLSASTGYSVRSGAISDDETSWIEVVVNGAGTLSFQSKSSCEFDPDGTCTWDHLAVFVGTDEKKDFRIDGNTPWARKEIQFTSSGSHTVRWVYVKDVSDSDGEDCVWLSGISWMPAAVSNPIPELSATATASEVVAALEGSADAKLAVNIKTASEYAAYRTWALGLEGVTPEQVKSSPNAWLSFALDTDALIATVPMEGDIVIDTFESAATDGAFEFAAKIDGITVGDNALEANIRKVFDIEGAEKLVSGGAGFSPDNVALNSAAPQDGNVKFTVMPKGGGEGVRRPTSFFFRVKMK
jgi:hypothetical protein